MFQVLWNPIQIFSVQRAGLEMVHVVHHLTIGSGRVVPKHNGEKNSSPHNATLVKSSRVVLRYFATDFAPRNLGDSGGEFAVRGNPTETWFHEVVGFLRFDLQDPCLSQVILPPSGGNDSVDRIAFPGSPLATFWKRE